MAKQSVNIGSSENKGDGDPLRTAFQKINENFDELYVQHGSDTGVVGTESTVDINVNETKIASFTSEGLIPELDETYNLGSPDKKWNSLYVAAETIFLGDKTLSANKILDFDLNISPEILEIQLDEPTAGHGTAWLWTWTTSSLPYTRTVITNSPETIVPLYMQGQYQINNFASSIHGDMTQTHSFKLKWVEGAGDDNLVDWVNYATLVKSHPDIDSGNSHTITVLQFTVPAEITIPTLNLPTVNYYVEAGMNDGSLNWMFMPDPANPTVTGTSHGFNPTIGPWYRGGTYIINVNAAGHPFYLTTDETAFAAGEYIGEYTTGVTGSRTDVGTVTIVVPMDAPDTLYYQCGNHQSMRGEIRVKDLEVETNENGNYIIYGQHSQEEHFTKIELRPIPALVDQMCLVYDQANNKFVPQDLATYVERTPSLKNKIKEVAGTAGTTTTSTATATVAGTRVLYDSNYLPVIGNESGDTAFATDTGKFYIWANNNWNTPAAETAGATSGNWELLDEVSFVTATEAAVTFENESDVLNYSEIKCTYELSDWYQAPVPNAYQGSLTGASIRIQPFTGNISSPSVIQHNYYRQYISTSGGQYLHSSQYTGSDLILTNYPAMAYSIYNNNYYVINDALARKLQGYMSYYTGITANDDNNGPSTIGGESFTTYPSYRLISNTYIGGGEYRRTYEGVYLYTKQKVIAEKVPHGFILKNTNQWMSGIFRLYGRTR
jgi:hypothetical protein